MRVVSNTSPICNLAVIGRLDLLEQRYGNVVIPAAVAAELRRLRHPNGKMRIDAALASGWLKVDPRVLPALVLPFPIDTGEHDAIALATISQADVLLIDEKRGRAAARQLGLNVAGILGELLHAKFAGRIPNLGVEITRLRVEAGFFIDQTIEQFILNEAGE
jgi:uncharacterized protein